MEGNFQQFKIRNQIEFSFKLDYNRVSDYTVKLGFKERLNKEQLGNSEPVPVINLPVFLINNEEIGISLVNNFVMTKKFLIAKFDCS